ncbi:enoyl-CoA delta isomerase 1, mitochondrial-like [Trichoplusia ni]|uniref:Enoyl-CoA delta isomerase 1, mitochondrial-like n=1 Tax=Trichoplusia ni TaxID=7111 RepID=A0A7E5WC77_TRINI|nr:enoyl-CoA delta isomerase 1, mitochondrial-like [Trichoplusia ni]XP_026738250.1 enoyl-CoA delta isomerase 1, mitochondrial-like [Trichoplusia ni]
MLHWRKVSKEVARVAVKTRCLSSAPGRPLVELSIDKEGIATVQMQRAPVNSLNVELMRAIHDSVSDLEKDKCKGMILTSASPTVFSAGMDLMELHNPEIKRLEEFSSSMFDIILKLFSSSIVTTAAINGYSGAGACVVALALDYRTMTTGKAKIGLNDTAVGISPAQWIAELMTRIMGKRNTEYALTTSHMFSAEQAVKVGLIDEVATDKTDAVQRCKNFIKLHDNIVPAVRNQTKLSLRKDFITDFKGNREQNLKNFMNMIMNPAFQNGIDQYVRSLKQKKAKSTA